MKHSDHRVYVHLAVEQMTHYCGLVLITVADFVVDVLCLTLIAWSQRCSDVSGWTPALSCDLIWPAAVNTWLVLAVEGPAIMVLIHVALLATVVAHHNE